MCSVATYKLKSIPGNLSGGGGVLKYGVVSRHDQENAVKDFYFLIFFEIK